MIQCHILPAFPNGKLKAFTLSYDDGVNQDIRFIELLEKYNLSCTFNLNSACYDGTFPDRDFLIYKRDFIEVACHTVTHPHIKFLPSHAVAAEITENRMALEALTGKIIRGYASPYGDDDERLREIAKLSGIAYGRTVKSSHSFDLPEDALGFNPTCHHSDDKLFELADNFLSGEVTCYSNPWLFYVWGHTYEFDRGEGEWERIEEFFKKISGKSDVWYATNIEIIDYLRDYSRLEYSADATVVHNPTAREIFLRSTLRYGEGNQQFNDILISVKPNETVDLKELPINKK